MKHEQQIDALFKAVLSLKDIEECYLFFEDLCTMKELKDLATRLEIAKALNGGASYIQAAEQTGVSSATVGRVKRCLDYGPGGYELILSRMEEEKA